MAWRAISDSVPHSESLAALSDGAERLYWRMVAVSDWWGRLEGKPRKVKAKTMPMVRRTDAQIAKQLVELVEVGRIVVYESEGEPYVQIVDFDKYQPTEYVRKRGKASKFPEPPANGQQAWHFPELLRPRTKHSHKEVDEDGEEKRSRSRTTNLARKNRARDEIWDTLEQELGAVTNANTRGKRNKAVQLIRESLNGHSDAPAEIRRRTRRYHERFPGAALTDTALANNWDALATRSKPATRKADPEPEPELLSPEETRARLEQLKATVEAK